MLTLRSSNAENTAGGIRGATARVDPSEDYRSGGHTDESRTEENNSQESDRKKARTTKSVKNIQIPRSEHFIRRHGYGYDSNRQLQDEVIQAQLGYPGFCNDGITDIVGTMKIGDPIVDCDMSLVASIAIVQH